MKIAAVLFLIAISVVLAGGVTVKSFLFPAASTTTYVTMVPRKPMNVSAFTLCMRVATELTGWRDIILFAYRTIGRDELTVWREKDARLSFYLAEQGVFFRVPDLSGMMTHLCFTWDSSTGASAVFIKGRRSFTKVFKKGHKMKSGGQALLGQDPDSYVGSFDYYQSFVGEISDLNMWDSVLSDTAIQDLSCGDSLTFGNVFDWRTLRFQLHGQVQLMKHEL